MPYNEARQAQAYRELEADIRHLVRSAHIAACLAEDPPVKVDDDDFVLHALYQVQKEADALKIKNYALDNDERAA